MKISFEVEKNYKGKTYYPNIVYEFKEEEAREIIDKTKYAHVFEKVERKVESKKDSMEKIVKNITKKNKKEV